MQRYLFIAIGGALGSILRYYVGVATAERFGPRFPFGTLVINITACFLIGLSIEYLNRHAGLNPAWRYLVPIGFIGAYSTFSTFEWETFVHLQTGDFLVAALYVSLSVLLGLLAVWLGVMLARLAF